MKNIILLLCAYLGITAPSTAQTPGSVDPDFGENGLLSLTWEGLFGNIGAVEQLPDGKTLLLINNSLLKILPDGSPDESFSGGVVKLPEFPPINTSTLLRHCSG